MIWIGLLAGALLGALVHGFAGMLAGALIGVVIGSLLRTSPQAPTARASSQSSGVTDAAIASALGARIAALETRLASLEKTLVDSGIALPRAIDTQPTTDAAVVSAEQADTALQHEKPVADAAPSAQPPHAATHEAASPALATPVRKGGRGAPSAAGESFAPVPVGMRPSTPLPRNRREGWVGEMLWAWFTGGNAIVRVGVVVLFFGIAFLLSYFAEHFTVPIELKFAGVALLGAAMMALGAQLRGKRPAYALALVGGGCGVLYLTTFSALQLVPLLTPQAAFALLVAIAVLTVILALRFDSQALAARTLPGNCEAAGA